MKKFFAFLFIFLCLFFSFDIKKVQAVNISDEIDNQLNELDLSSLEEFFDKNYSLDNENFFSIFSKIIKGDNSVKYDSFLSYITNIFFGEIKGFLPFVFIIIAISILLKIFSDNTLDKSKESIDYVIEIVGLITITVLIFPSIYSLYENIKNAIENIAKLCEIMSPIVSTIMITSGQNSTISVFKPAVIFYINIVLGIFIKIVFPLILFCFIFCFLSSVNKSIKLDNFIKLFQNTIKWILGLITSVFALFITVQGIASKCFDSVSIRATKYALTNSIPIVNGIVNVGFDFVLASSYIIKNSVGIVSIILVFFMIISPLVKIAVFSLLLNFTGAIISVYSDSKITELCMSLSKNMGYLVSTLIISFIMFFVLILFMVISFGTVI